MRENSCSLGGVYEGEGWTALVWRETRRAAKEGPGGWVRAVARGCVLAAVGILRIMSNCEEMATSDSVWICPRGMLWWRVAKKARRACMDWWALGELLVQVVHNLC